MSSAQPALSSSEMFTQCGYALCGHGSDWKSRFGQLLGGIKPDKIDAMSKGKSRIPPGIWSEIAVHLHDRALFDLVALRDRAIAESLAPLARVYKVRNIEFGVEPSVDGRWPTLMISNKPYQQVGWWRPVKEYEFRLPDDTLSGRLEFDGVAGDPFLLTGIAPIHYPSNMKRAPDGAPPSPTALDEAEINEKAEAARQAWLRAQSHVTRLFATALHGGRNPTMEELEDVKHLKRVYEDLHKRRLVLAAQRHGSGND
jgi:hypothetical protein